jgi:hypothetical protein
MNDKKAPVTAIYAGIGRGHPNYLDSVLRSLRLRDPDAFRQIRVVLAPTLATGLSNLGWRAVRGIYRQGARGGIVSRFYSRFRARRSAYDPDALAARLLGRDLLKDLAGYRGICLVAHPLLAAILARSHRVCYLHGEIAAPAESAVRDVERIYVPIKETAGRMVSQGVNRSILVETGLVIEPELVPNCSAAVTARIGRLNADTPLTIGFFVSGAYPSDHVRFMLAAARSCLSSGMRVRMFWGTDRRERERLIAKLENTATPVIVDDSGQQSQSDAPLVIVSGTTREQETLNSLQYLPSLDVFCAAPHERINWAAGAGLPMVMIGPPIGSFAPENRQFVLESRCGIELSTITGFRQFAERIQTMRASGSLVRMAEAGIGKHAINGAEMIARDLLFCAKS